MIGGRLVSLAAATTLDLSPADTVGVAATAGFDAAGLWFDPATWTVATTRQVRGRMDATAMLALDIEPVILGPDGDPGDRLIDVAIEVGARHALVACRWTDRVAAIERFGQLCDRASGSELRVVLEFLPIFAIRTLTDALDVVSAAGRPNAGVLVDSLHLARSGGSPDDLAAVDPHLLPYLQLADAPAESPLPEGLYEEAVHGRLLPGEGGLPLRRVLRVVPDVPLSIELRSRALRTAFPDPLDRAKVVWAATASVMSGPCQTT